MQFNSLEFLAAFLPGETRKLTRTGVEIHCLQYWSDTLAPWVGQHKDVLVTYDPRDITVVYTRTPGGAVVRCVVTTPGISAISLAEWQARRRYEQSLGNDPKRLATRDASMSRSDLRASEAKASRRVRRRLATKAAGDRFLGAPAPTVTLPLELDTDSHAIPESMPTGDITAHLIYELDTYD